jgi:hypothetical protein
MASKIQLVMRVGFSGHRDLGLMDRDALVGILKKQLNEILRIGRDLCEQEGEFFEQAPKIELITGLAEGADLCAAEAAVDVGATLVAVSPFAWEEFLEDFEGEGSEKDRDRAKNLWRRSETKRIELVAELGDPKVRSKAKDADARRIGYRAQGKFILGHSDVLMIFLDEARGQGGEAGTFWTKRNAGKNGIPVISVDQAGNVSVQEHEALRDEGQQDSSEGTAHSVNQISKLEAEIRRAFLHESTKVHAGEMVPLTLFGMLAGIPDCIKTFWRTRILCERPAHQESGEHECAPETSYEDDYSKESPVKERSRTSRFTASCYDTVLRLSGGREPPKTEGAEKLDRAGLPPSLLEEFDRADELAIHYNGLHRFGVMIIYLMGFFAVLMAVVGHVLVMTSPDHASHWPTWIEIGLLAGIGVAFAMCKRWRWRAKGTDYRFLAETLRAAIHLHPLRSRPALPAPKAHGSDGAAHTSWMMWYARHCLRQVPFETVKFDDEATKRCASRLQGQLILDQLQYHRKTASRYKVLECRLTRATILFFALAVYGCLCHLYPSIWGAKGLGNWALVFTAALPALVAALHSIATHGEIARLERRYEAMAHYLKGVSKELEEKIMKKPPINREKLLQIAGDVTKRMMDEVSEWRWLHAVHDAKLP